LEAQKGKNGIISRKVIHVPIGTTAGDENGSYGFAEDQRRQVG
jgi:hypothetical protein